MKKSGNTKAFLFGALLNTLILDYSNYLDYALKALIGGLIWMGFKLAGDYLHWRYLEKLRKEEKDKKAEEIQDRQALDIQQKERL